MSTIIYTKRNSTEQNKFYFLSDALSFAVNEYNKDDSKNCAIWDVSMQLYGISPDRDAEMYVVSVKDKAVGVLTISREEELDEATKEELSKITIFYSNQEEVKTIKSLLDKIQTYGTVTQSDFNAYSIGSVDNPTVAQKLVEEGCATVDYIVDRFVNACKIRMETLEPEESPENRSIVLEELIKVAKSFKASSK